MRVGTAMGPGDLIPVVSEVKVKQVREVKGKEVVILLNVVKEVTLWTMVTVVIFLAVLNVRTHLVGKETQGLGLGQDLSMVNALEWIIVTRPAASMLQLLSLAVEDPLSIMMNHILVALPALLFL
mmetsp:Transcript_4643/g.5382  ORF Transcript_4643/g.5382 Transcript_4643/m.5382 type:complete len:125 (-) Transcript_4643:57-431(-)